MDLIHIINPILICVILSIIGRKGFGMSRLMAMLAGVSLNLLQAVDNTTPLFLCLQVLPLRRTVSSPPLSLGRQALRVLTVWEEVCPQRPPLQTHKGPPQLQAQQDYQSHRVIPSADLTPAQHPPTHTCRASLAQLRFGQRGEGPGLLRTFGALRAGLSEESRELAAVSLQSFCPVSSSPLFYLQCSLWAAHIVPS